VFDAWANDQQSKCLTLVDAFARHHGRYAALAKLWATMVGMLARPSRFLGLPFWRYVEKSKDSKIPVDQDEPGVTQDKP
jgi:hypothetical protein